MNNINYIKNCRLDNFYKTRQKNIMISKLYLNNLSNTKCSCNEIHIIVINNTHCVTTRDILSDLLNDLINKYPKQHLTIIYYGECVKQIIEIVPLDKNIVEHVLLVSEIDYDSVQKFNYEQVENAIQARELISNTNFSCLDNYERVFIHDRISQKI